MQENTSPEWVNLHLNFTVCKRGGWARGRDLYEFKPGGERTTKPADGAGEKKLARYMYHISRTRGGGPPRQRVDFIWFHFF
jgi:hypothetical protein